MKKKLLRLDLGTGKGKGKPEGFVGVDLVGGKGIEKVDLRKPWPWANGSVEEVNAQNLINYFTPSERIHFANELFRVLRPGGKAVIVVPHWASSRAHGDVLTQYPLVSESWFPFLKKEWREAQNFFINGYACDFDHTLGYGLHPTIVNRNLEYQQHAVAFWKEAAQDICATLTSLK